ncbi:hypothetical protein ACI2IY_05765 [Lysobacter enzymogenes]|uniref:hypothetical protein n=1 Tax=Lysobacter enzymogenes TaxID=69 RepID=UPI0038508C39
MNRILTDDEIRLAPDTVLDDYARSEQRDIALRQSRLAKVMRERRRRARVARHLAERTTRMQVENEAIPAVVAPAAVGA